MWRSIPLRVKTVAMIPKKLSQAHVLLAVERKARKRAELLVESFCGRMLLSMRLLLYHNFGPDCGLNFRWQYRLNLSTILNTKVLRQTWQSLKFQSMCPSYYVSSYSFEGLCKSYFSENWKFLTIRAVLECQNKIISRLRYLIHSLYLHH